MSSTFSGLNTMVRGIYTHQLALNTTGNNITNLNTDGYSRQRNTIVETPSEYVFGGKGQMAIGTGAVTDSIVRLRDELVEAQVRKGSTPLGYNNTMQDTLGKIENVFPEPSTTGLQNAMDNFWNAWQQLSTNASDQGSRSVVLQRGTELVTAIQSAATQLEGIQTDSTKALSTDVGTINQYFTELAAVNKQILASPTGSDASLKDQQDLLLEKISTLAPVQVTKQSYGSVLVTLGGMAVVDKGNSYLLDTDVGTTGNLKMAGTGTEVVLGEQGGELQGLIDSRDATAPAFLAKLGTMSQFLLSDFNAVHRSGYGLDNETNVNFFGDSTFSNVSGQEGTTLQLISSTTVAAGTLVPAAEILTLGDGIGTMPVNLAKDWTVSQVADAINAQAEVSNINVRAVYDSTNQKFQLYNTGAGKKITTSEPTGSSYLSSTLHLDTPSYTDWLDQLQVNPDLTATNGLSKIAARVAAANAGLTSQVVKSSSIWQGNGSGGAMTASVTGNYTFDPSSLPIRVRINALTTNADGAKAPSSLSYSTDGTTWTPIVPDSSNNYEFTLQGATVKMSILANSSNTVNDVYVVTLPAGNESVGSGDNCVTLSNLLKVTQSSVLGNTSLDGFYGNLIASLGTQSQNAKNQATNQDSLVSQIKTIRDAVSGVNLDEELTNMIKFQKGYNGCARMLTAMDEMLDKLINSTGTVGR